MWRIILRLHPHVWAIWSAWLLLAGNKLQETRIFCLQHSKQVELDEPYKLSSGDRMVPILDKYLLWGDVLTRYLIELEMYSAFAHVVCSSSNHVSLPNGHWLWLFIVGIVFLIFSSSLVSIGASGLILSVSISYSPVFKHRCYYHSACLICSFISTSAK